MDINWISLFKNVMRKCCVRETDHRSVRMSETEIISVSSHQADLKLNTENKMYDNADSPISICNIVNDLKSNFDNEDNEVIMKMNTGISKTNNTVGQAIKSSNEYENRLPKLIINPNIEQTCFINDFDKARTPVDDKNSSEFVITNHQENSGNHTTPLFKQKQPIMGRTALLKKANIDPDSLIIQGIILNKYEGVLNHYVHRIYKRRISRLSSSEDEFGDMMSTPASNYSPSVFSPIDTPGSIRSTKNRFEFPVPENSYNIRDRLKFLMSTDDINVETTAEEMNESSLISSDYGNTMSMTSFSEYDTKKFLDNALGEVTNFGESEICYNNLLPHENSQNEHSMGLSNTIPIDNYQHSIGSSNLSSLISKASSFCSSMKKNIKRRHTILKSIRNVEESIASKQLLESYKKELSIQNAIMFQISKALNYCRSSKEFDSGVEHIEAEKILLVATIRKEALINEINSIEFNTYQNNFDPRCSGEIQLQNLTFHLKNNTTTESQPNTREHFLVVLSCGRVVSASEVVKEIDGTVYFGKTFQFENLSTDFEINLSIYSMSVRSKIHSNQDKCPSPKSIFKFSKDSKKFKFANTLYIEPLAFSLLGKCVIRISDLPKITLDKESNLKLHNVSTRCSVSDNFTFTMSYKFNLTTKVSGFLTLGTENGNVCTTWNRRWCVLDSFIFKYWNYPSEESSDPLGIVDLRFCMVQSISVASRSICARSKTLFVPLKNGADTKRYLLCADSISDMNMWEKELNFVLQSLVVWNGMKSQM